MASRKDRIRSELLVLRYRTGDAGALAEIVAMWERPLFYYIRRIVDSEEDAWDLLQEVWCQVVRKIGKLREPGVFPAWLYTIARNAAKNHLRDNPSFSEFAEDNSEASRPNSDPEPSFSAQDAEEIHWALGKLSLPHREALALHFIEGFSLAEIGAITDQPVGTVKSRLHYAKKALRAVLEKEAR